MHRACRAPHLEHGLIEVGEQGVEKEPLFWSRDVKPCLGKGGEEITLGQRLVGLGIVELEGPISGQHQQRRASERGFDHGRQIVRSRRPRGAHEAGQDSTLRRSLGPEGGTAFVVEQFRDHRRIVFQRQNERYSACAWGETKHLYTTTAQFLDHYRGMKVRETSGGHHGWYTHRLPFLHTYSNLHIGSFDGSL